MPNKIINKVLHSRHMALFWLLCFALPTLGHAASMTDELKEIRTLANSGAASLALRTLERLQPDITQDQAKWMLLERERIHIYRQSQQWQALVTRVDNTAGHVPPEYLRWALTQQVDAFIRLNKGKKALSVLQELIWNLPPQGADNQKWLAHWRRQVINSYLANGDVDDAHKATTRYFQDYDDQALNNLILRARILLMSGHADQVIELLADKSEQPEAGMLYLLAQLRGDFRSPKKVVQAGLRHLRGNWVGHDLSSHLWAVVAEAAQRSGDRATTANALEHVIAGQQRTPLPAGLFDFDVDSLWNAYIDFATYLGNKQQFLIGQDEEWFAAAKQAEQMQPVRARSFYALLMFNGQSEQSRHHAVKRFIAMMKKRPYGAHLLNQLFLHSRHFKNYADVPEPGRHALVDIALARSKIDLASALMATIKEPPAGADKYFWQLRRAWIFVLGGNTGKGAEALLAILDQYPQLERDQLDKLLKIVFDLQKVGAHEQAYAVFDKVKQVTQDETLQREIYYWMAESREASEDYTDAARLYLKSAMLPGEDSMDLWAQSARYHAADVLAKAGLVNDARTLFTQLLNVTKEPGRRAVLQHELQKLWLIRN